MEAFSVAGNRDSKISGILYLSQLSTGTFIFFNKGKKVRTATLVARNIKTPVLRGFTY